MKYIYITERKGKANKGNEDSSAVLAYSLSALPFSCLSKFLFPLSLSLPLSPWQWGWKIVRWTLECTLKVDLLSWPWSICPHFPSSDYFPHLSTPLSSFSPFYWCQPSLQVCRWERWEHFSPLSCNCFPLCSPIAALKITLAGVVAGSVFMHLSRIIKVDSLLLNVTRQNQTCCKTTLSFPKCGLSKKFHLINLWKKQNVIFFFLFLSRGCSGLRHPQAIVSTHRDII